MKNRVTVSESRLHLQNIEKAAQYQEILMRESGKDDEFREISGRVLLRLKLTIAMLRAQHVIIVENSVCHTGSDELVEH